MRLLIFFFLLLVSVGLAIAQTLTKNQVVSASSINHHVEMLIAINPTNKNNLIGAAVVTPDGKVAYYYTFDGGTTWGWAEDFPNGGDPVVAFDSYGIGYLLYQNTSDRKLYLHKSTNGGQNWSAYRRTVVAKNLPYNVDKPWMAISSVKNANNQNDIVITYRQMNENNALDEIHKAVSSDSGATFTDSDISDEARYHSPVIAFGPSGNHYVAWGVFGDQNDPAKETAIRFSFSSYSQSVNQIGTKLGAKYVIKNSQISVNSWPSIDVDRTEGPRSGWVYVAWANKYSQSPFDADILLIRSTNGGATWSSPIRVNNDPVGNGKDQWFPFVAVDPDGNVNLILYDSRNSGDNQSGQLYFARSTDGGTSFTNTSAGDLFSVVATQANFVGDYIQLANWTGKGWALWMRHDGTKYRPWLAEITMPTTSVIVKNDFSGTNAGSITVIEHPNTTSSYTSGTQFSWPNPSLRKIQATDPYYNPLNDGQNWGFRDWNNQLNDFTNPKVFGINSQTSFITSFFRKIYPVTVQTNLVDASSNTGTVQFKDPLGLNQYENRGSPFYEITFLKRRILSTVLERFLL